MPSNPALDSAVYRLSRTIYVVLFRQKDGRLNLVPDPGMGKPWSSKNKRMADQVAKEHGGEARTWQEAFDLLKKDDPEFERRLTDAVTKKQQIVNTKKSLLSPNTLLNQYGKPVPPDRN